MRARLVGLTVVAMVATFAPLSPVVTSGASAAPASSGPGYTLEGCQQDGPHAGHLTLPNGDGKFICPDNAYTTGNLSKGWNELDLVPHRVTLAHPPAGSVTLNLGGDHLYTQGSTAVGWDVVSEPVLNTSKSGSGCPSVSSTGQTIVQNSNGGAYDSVQRAVTFTGASNATGDCVYDYYQRLALGAHLYSGSSLQSYVNSSYSGEKRISLPVREALPQQLSKDMSATQDSDYTWNLTKEASPTTLPLGNTCPNVNGTTGGVTITVSWTRGAATPSGSITVISNVYADNPAARSVTVTVGDVLYSGTTALDSTSFGPVVVTSGAHQLVGTWTTTVPAGTTDLNDIATGTYTDTVTGVPIPGSTTATASATVQSSGVSTNATATITDTESITGTGLTFKVAAPSSGSFTGGYVAGTYTTGPVGWSSGTVSGNGSVVFTKTVRAAQGTSTSSGSLSDSATLTASDGFTVTRTAATSITSATYATLSLTKTIPNILQGSDTADFTLQVATGSTYDASNVVASHTFHFTAGQTSLSYDVTDLPSGSYVVHEVPTTGWAPRADVPISLTGPVTATPNACAGSVTFNNGFAPPSVHAVKVTVPAGSEGGWDMTLTRPDLTTVTVTTDSTGLADFGNQSQEGAYTIVETAKAGWDQTNAVGCSFTINLPADNDRLFTCTITNTQRGSITIVKNAVPDSPQDFGFTTSGSGLSAFSLDDDADPTLPNTRTFSNLVPGSYSVTETGVTGWDLTGLSCVSTNSTSTLGTNLGTGVSSITLAPGDSVTCTYTNTQRAHVTVLKTENGGVPTHTYTFRLTGGPDNVSYTQATDGTNLGNLSFPLVKPGSYTLCELAVPAATHSTLQDFPGATVNSTTGDVCLTFTLTAGETRAFTIDNSYPGGGQRTIGYWKNWASCSTTGNNRVAMAAKTGNHLLDEFLPQTLGGYTVDTCAKGVAVLSAASGKYAENQLAAQLLAAKLNVSAGASSCATVTNAITHGDALLTQIGYAGPPSYKVGSTSSLRSDVLATASTLDRYNNGLIC